VAIPSNRAITPWYTPTTFFSHLVQEMPQIGFTNTT